MDKRSSTGGPGLCIRLCQCEMGGYKLGARPDYTGDGIGNHRLNVEKIMRVKADYHAPDEFLRFDQYSVAIKDGEFHVMQILKDLDLFAASIVAGVTQDDFVESICYTGWCGTCPEWTNYHPVVTVPRGGILALDQLGFMMESLQ